jgi:hypothetical protein
MHAAPETIGEFTGASSARKHQSVNKAIDYMTDAHMETSALDITGRHGSIRFGSSTLRQACSRLTE